MNEHIPKRKSHADSTRRQFLKHLGAGAVATTVAAPKSITAGQSHRKAPTAGATKPGPHPRSK